MAFRNEDGQGMEEERVQMMMEFLGPDCNLFEMLKGAEIPVVFTEDPVFDEFFLNEDTQEGPKKTRKEANKSTEIIYFNPFEKNLVLTFWLKELLLHDLKELKASGQAVSLNDLDFSPQIVFLDFCQEFSFISLYEELKKELHAMGFAGVERMNAIADVLLKNIFVIQAFSNEEMNIAIKNLGFFLDKNKRVKLVVIDCINSHDLYGPGGKEKKQNGRGNQVKTSPLEAKLIKNNEYLLKEYQAENQVFFLTTKREYFSLFKAVEKPHGSDSFKLADNLEKAFNSFEIIPKTQRFFVCEDEISGLEELFSKEETNFRKKKAEDNAQIAIKKVETDKETNYLFMLFRILNGHFRPIQRGEIPMKPILSSISTQKSTNNDLFSNLPF